MFGMLWAGWGRGLGRLFGGCGGRLGLGGGGGLLCLGGLGGRGWVD